MKKTRELVREGKLNSVRRVVLEARKSELVNEINKCLQLEGKDVKYHISCVETELWQVCDELCDIE